MKHVVRVVIMAAMLLILAVPVEAAGKNARLNTTSITMSVGTKTKLKLMKYKKVSKKQLKKVKWTSSNKKVATVKSSGKYKQNATITAKASGNATIKLKYNGKTYRCKITVNQKDKRNQKGDAVDDEDEEDDEDTPEKKKDDTIAATSITIDQGKELILTEGDIYQLTASVIPSNAPVQWISLNPEVATVDQNGLVTTLKGGKVGIACEGKNKTAIMAIQVNLKPKYTYECYLLGDVYNSGFWAVGLYDAGCTPIYIKTDNPNPETIEMQYVTNVLACHNFVDVKYLADDDKGNTLRKVPGGYLGLLWGNLGTYEKNWQGYYFQNFDHKLQGTVTALIREFETSDHSEWSKPYAEAGSFTFEVKDFETEMNAWMDQVIAEYTTPDMNVHEKMLALSKYMMDEFEYMPHVADREGYGSGGGMALAQKIEPFFKTHLVESTKGPELLVKFGEKIGYNLVTGDDYSNTGWHGYVIGTYNGITYGYCACPQREGVYHFSEITEYDVVNQPVGASLYYVVEGKDDAYNRYWYPETFMHRNIQYVDFSKFK